MHQPHSPEPVSKIHYAEQRERNKAGEEATGQKRSKMEEKEYEAKPIDWDSSGFYTSLPNKEDCCGETTARAHGP